MPKHREKLSPGALFAKSGEDYFKNVRYDGNIKRYSAKIFIKSFAEFFQNWDKYVGNYPELRAIVEKNAYVERIFCNKIRRKSGYIKHRFYIKFAVMICMGYIYMRLGDTEKAIKEYEIVYSQIKKELRIK